MGVGGRVADLPPKEDFLVDGVLGEFGGFGIEADGIGLSGEDDEVVVNGLGKNGSGESDDKCGGFEKHRS